VTMGKLYIAIMNPLNALCVGIITHIKLKRTDTLSDMSSRKEAPQKLKIFYF